MKKMTVNDITGRLLMKQKFVVIEGEVRSPAINQLCRETSIYDFEDAKLWRLIGKRVVHSIIAKGDVIYIYVEEMGDNQ